MFGLITKKKHTAQITQLQQQIDILNRSVKSLSVQLGKLNSPRGVEPENLHQEQLESITVGAAKEPKKTLVTKNSRLATLEEVLPDIHFYNEGATVKTKFNGKEVNVKVREKRSNGAGWGCDETDVGEVLVLLDKGKLYGVCIVKRDWLTDRNSVWIPSEQARAIGIKMSTNRVLRNFG